MANAEPQVGICLYQLPAREAAVVRRVISFSEGQGRHFVLAELAAARIILVADQESIPTGGLPDAVVVRLGEAGSTAPYDILLPRPLLVTRVMRALDEAKALLDNTASTAEMPVDTDTDTGVAASVVTDGSVPVEDDAPIDAPAAEVDAPAAEDDAPAAEDDAPAAEGDAPAAEVDAPAAEGDAPAAEDDAPVTGQYRALVVDDSAAIRKQLELELRAAGLRVAFAESGEQALTKVAAETFDLIFLDVIMPGIDGYETCRQLRAMPALKKTPVIMLSAKTSPLDEVQGVIAGATTYLTKPVKSEQLQKTLARVSMWLNNFSM